MTEPVDFTSCQRIPGRAYNGANGKKIAVDWQGACWILKFPPSAAEKPNDLSYSNSCFSEHVASTIFGLLGFRVQETCLGTYRNGREHVVCACRDFTDVDTVLHDFCSIKNTVLDTGSNGAGTDLDAVLETIDKQQFVDPVELRCFFWDMFVADAFLGNFDRHNGNWGFLVNRRTGRSEIAPVFDCGSCLLPQADERIMRLILEDGVSTLENCAILCNRSIGNYEQGAALQISHGTGRRTIRNCTIVGNTFAKTNNAAIYGYAWDAGKESVHLYNNIVWGNTCTAVGAIHPNANNYSGQKWFVKNNCWDYDAAGKLQDPDGGTDYGNVNADPQFDLAHGGAPLLLLTSPCRNRGDNALGSAAAADLLGNPRRVGRKIDIGCVECQNGPGFGILVR